MAITVALIGTLLAASTGIVGASWSTRCIKSSNNDQTRLFQRTRNGNSCRIRLSWDHYTAINYAGFYGRPTNLPAGDLFMGAFIPGLMLAHFM